MRGEEEEETEDGGRDKCENGDLNEDDGDAGERWYMRMDKNVGRRRWEGNVMGDEEEGCENRDQMKMRMQM